MLVVTLPEAEISPYLTESCDLAAINGPELCVLSGPLTAIEAAESDLGNQGVGTRRLHVSHAFHSAMVEPMLPASMDMVSRLELGRPRFLFSPILVATGLPRRKQPTQVLERHLRGTVRFDDGLRELLSNPTRSCWRWAPAKRWARSQSGIPDERGTIIFLLYPIPPERT